MDIDPSTYEVIQKHCARGDDLLEAGQTDGAIAAYRAAFSLVPEPKVDWFASTWILAALADALFLAGDTAEARTTLEFAMACPEAIGNPFLHLRLGQALFDLGELDASANELIRAFMGAGSSIFADEDPKYLEFLKTRADIKERDE